MAFPDVSMKNTEEELTLIRAIFSAISVWLETVASPTKQPLLDAINDYKTALEEEAAEVP